MEEHQLPLFFSYRIMWHILFWVVVFFMYVVTFGGYMGNYSEEMNRNLLLMPTRIIGTYILTYAILPIALKKKQFLFFSFLVVVHALIFGFFIWLTLSSFHYSHKHPDYSVISLFNPIKILGTLFSNYVVPMVAVALVIFKKWYLDEQHKARLTKEKLAAELNFLKSQVHPHFLFNTLNNLYALTLIKSEKTPDIVLKLSSLLDYMIYKSNDKFVPLHNELEILESYIELEKLRYNKRLDFDYQIIGEPGSHTIAPLLMLPFIENSFKHGASNDRSKPTIRIKIEIETDCLKLNVINSIPEIKESDETLGEGIGLKNVRRRLELIYPKMYKLDIQKSKKQFEVNLKVYWINE